MIGRIWALVRLGLHCAFRGHQDWVLSVDDVPVARGCSQCNRAFWVDLPDDVTDELLEEFIRKAKDQF